MDGRDREKKVRSLGAEDSSAAQTALL